MLRAFGACPEPGSSDPTSPRREASLLNLPGNLGFLAFSFLARSIGAVQEDAGPNLLFNSPSYIDRKKSPKFLAFLPESKNFMP